MSESLSRNTFEALVAAAGGIAVRARPQALPEPAAEAEPNPAADTVRCDRLQAAVERAMRALLAAQREDGHWCFELEADCTIPAEYILLLHYLGEQQPERQRKIAAYLRRRQAAHGGWPLYYGGELDLSCSVKAYFALKLAGDDPNAPHMQRARESILAHGGAARCNVFTRIALALFGQVPWRAVPYIPPEIILLPRWFPFHISKVAYWSRTVLVPLFVIYAKKPRAANPNGTDIRELFTVAPERERHYFPIRSPLNRVFLWLERTSRLLLDPLVPGFIRRAAIARAEAWFVERLNGEDGLGGIFPAMVNALIALDLLGYDKTHPLRCAARQAIDRLLVEKRDEAYCQPCVSPVWDTGLSALALQETGDPAAEVAIERGLDWLAAHQTGDEPGDWRDNHPTLPGGGWAFQYNNAHYPDLDDTAAVAWAMLNSRQVGKYETAIARAVTWLAGMRSKNGGFASFDADNTHYYLNEIPFADHGALLDPPTADVSARVLGLIGRYDDDAYRDVVEHLLVFLKKEQEPTGPWFGRWGTNYIYGTWSVLAALEQFGADPREPWIRAAANWLKAVQRDDGGWGETNDSYNDPALAGRADHATAHHTAWALLGLIAAGEGHSPAVSRGIEWLIASQDDDGMWSDSWYTAPGFPRVFYLKYHGYSSYFPLWALARYRNLVAGS